MKAKARAHANIALIKYWGKRDEDLALPYNSSLSLTLDQFYTETEVEFSEDFIEDSFHLDGKEDNKTLEKVSRFLDLFREKKGINLKARVTSVNHVPTAAGLASSASAFAALGMAANAALELNLNKKDLSKLVRRGSGSASRSLYGGFTIWHKGEDDASSYAEFLDDASWDLAMIAIIVNSTKKKVSSREGMKQTVLTSPFYKEWPKEAEKDLLLAKEAIKERDFETLGMVAENNAFKMHATMMGAKPSIMYFEADSIKAIQSVKALRDQNILAYATMDAGPNVKVLCRASDVDIIMKELRKEFKENCLVVSYPGFGAQLI